MAKYIVNGWKPGTYWSSVEIEADNAHAAIQPGLDALNECDDWELSDDGAASNDVDYLEILPADGTELFTKWEAPNSAPALASFVRSIARMSMATIDDDAMDTIIGRAREFFPEIVPADEVEA